MGIDALTVRPIFSARYTFEAPKISPRITPRISARGVSSASDWDGEIYGWWSAIGSPVEGPRVSGECGAGGEGGEGR